MKALIATLLCFGTLHGLHANAGEKVEQQLDADPAGVVLIENVRGEVRVKGWEQPRVAVSGELDDLAEGMEFQRSGKLVTLKVRLPERNINSGDGSSLEIFVPAASRVEFSGVSSSLDLRNTSGGAEVRSVSGDVNLTTVKGDIALKTVSGALRVDGALGNAQLKSVSGNMKLALDSREITLSTVAGEITLALAEFERLSVNSVSGDLSINGRMAADARVEIKSVSGDVDLQLAGAVNARASLRTGPGGEISNGLSDARATTEFPAQQRLDTVFGDGGGSIAITTVTGDIDLQQP
jgi:hypothetical protein